jgi:protoporphyrinogen oxidase
MQVMIPNRIVIYAKDISNITGRKERTARKMIAQIRKKYKKKKGDFISVKEFCDFTGLAKDCVYPFLNG